MLCSQLSYIQRPRTILRAVQILGAEGRLLLQTDQPGMIASVGSVLAKHDLNISFMTVTRMGRGQDAIMAIGIDTQPSQVRAS